MLVRGSRLGLSPSPWFCAHTHATTIHRSIAWETYHVMVLLHSTLYCINKVPYSGYISVWLISFGLHYYDGITNSPKLGWLVTTRFGSKIIFAITYGLCTIKWWGFGLYSNGYATIRPPLVLL
jgi:hypothetical protein